MTVAEHCDKLTKTLMFRCTVALTIAIAAVIAGLGTYIEDDSYLHNVLYVIDWLFIVFFTVELSIRVVARNWRLAAIVGDGWLLFDIAIVVSSIGAQLIDTGESFYILRLARVFRAVRLLSITSKFRLVIESFLKSIKTSLYVVILLAVIIYGYAVLGVELFSSSNSFSHLGKAIISMIQILTLDDWGNIFADVLEQPTISKFMATTFFMSFIFFGTMIILNLFVAVVTDQMRVISDKNLSAKK